jgi:hypothetical protein
MAKKRSAPPTGERREAGRNDAEHPPSNQTNSSTQAARKARANRKPPAPRDLSAASSPTVDDAAPAAIEAPPASVLAIEATATLPIADIAIGERHRKDLGDIDGLAASIADIGLLNPITIDQTGRLLAGARRLAACKRLGLTDIEVRIVRCES